MRWLDDQRGLYHTLGPARYWTIMVGTVVFCIGFGTLVWWLSEKIGWPDAYGFQCRGKGCLFLELWHSPSLLQNPNGYALALFAALWFIPATTGIAVTIILARRALIRRRNRIRPME